VTQARVIGPDTDRTVTPEVRDFKVDVVFRTVAKSEDGSVVLGPSLDLGFIAYDANGAKRKYQERK
jgi:hypothetical protein